MASTCKGICVQYKSKGIAMKLKYKLGQKRCTYCGLFLSYDGTRCPCCQAILRTRSRSKAN